LSEHYNDEKAPDPDEMKRDDPRRLHEWLGMYYGDMIMRDRLYNYRKYTPTNEFPGYLIHGIVLTPKISIPTFMARRHQLKRLMKEYGQVYSYRPTHMDHVEAVLNHFAEESPLCFRKTKFLYSLAFATSFTKSFDRQFLIGIGYAVNREATSAEIPTPKGQYRGPFLQLLLRAPQASKEQQIELLELTMKSLEE
jgi:hypothetical protein